MIDKIKKLKAKRDALVERLDRLTAEKKGALSRVLENEDKGKNSDDLRHDLHGFAAEIEVTEAAIDRVDQKLKDQIADLIKSQLKTYPKEKARLLDDIKSSLFDTGKLLGKASHALEGLGPAGTGVASEILAVLKRNQHICQPIIAGRAEFLNEHSGIPSNVAKRSYFTRMSMLQKNPTEMGRTINKYFHRVLKDSYGSLEGRS